jgi:cyclopropane fatty-acyl-phospholipid synthase-like methyltransferase
MLNKNYKYKIENYNFWLNRLKNYKEDLVCTKDIILDEIRRKSNYQKYKTNNSSILELGCGNGVIVKKILKKKKLKVILEQIL